MILSSMGDNLVINDGVLKRVWESTDVQEVKHQMILPLSRRKEVLSEMHDGFSGGHLPHSGDRGFIRSGTTRRCPKNWCRKWVECAASKRAKNGIRGLMKQYNFGIPFERISIDVARFFQGPRKDFILAAAASKLAEASGLTNQEGKYGSTDLGR